jgi:hypothetical protein
MKRLFPAAFALALRLRTIVFTVGLFVMLAQTGCGSKGGNDASSRDQPAASDTQPMSPEAATTSADRDAREIAGTTVRFSSSTTSVHVTIGEDNPRSAISSRYSP